MNPNPPPDAALAPARRPGRGRPGRRTHLLAAGHLLTAASIGQVISNTTVWIVGILAGLATLFLTIGGAAPISTLIRPGPGTWTAVSPSCGARVSRS